MGETRAGARRERSSVKAARGRSTFFAAARAGEKDGSGSSENLGDARGWQVRWGGRRMRGKKIPGLGLAAVRRAVSHAGPQTPMRYPRSFVVDCGASHVACGRFAAGPHGALQLDAFLTRPHPADPAADARWTERVADTVAEARAGGMGTRCTLILPGHLALTKLVKTAAVARAKRLRIVQFEATQNIPYPLDEVVWSHVETADDGLELELLLAAAKRDVVEDLCARVEAAGVSVERVWPASFALWRAVVHGRGADDAPALVVDVGARSTHVLLVHGERRAVWRTFTLGGNGLTQAIAEELRLDFAQAETLKLQVLGGRSGGAMPDASRAAVERAAAGFAARVQAEVSRSLANFARQGAPAPAKIFLTGGGAAFAAASEAVAAGTGWLVERYAVWSNATLDVAVPKDAKTFGAATQLVGGAGRVSGGEASFNLLPPPLVARAQERRRGRQWLAAAALGVVALLGPVWHFDRRARAAETEARQLAARLHPVRQTRARNEATLAKLEETRKEIAALRSLYDTRTNWGQFFGDLQERLVKVEDVWLERLQFVRATEAVRAGEAPPPMKLTLSGRLLDRQNPVSKVSRESFEHVRELLVDLGQSPFVATVENERFDSAQPGILRFDCTLVINPQRAL